MGALPRYFDTSRNTCVNVNSVCPVSVGSTAPRTTGRPGPEMFIQRLLTEVFSSCVNVNATLIRVCERGMRHTSASI